MPLQTVVLAKRQDKTNLNKMLEISKVYHHSSDWINLNTSTAINHLNQQKSNCKLATFDE